MEILDLKLAVRVKVTEKKEKDRKNSENLLKYKN